MCLLPVAQGKQTAGIPGSQGPRLWVHFTLDFPESGAGSLAECSGHIFLILPARQQFPIFCMVLPEWVIVIKPVHLIPIVKLGML